MVLIFSSILLLLLFQFFWIRQNYYEQKNLLKDNIAQILNTTIVALQDSMIVKQIPLRLEKVIQKKLIAPKPVRANTKIWVDVKNANLLTDSALTVTDTSIKVVRFSFSRKPMPDSLKKILARMISVVQQKVGSSRLLIKVNGDSSKSFVFYPNKPDSIIISPQFGTKNVWVKIKPKRAKTVVENPTLTFQITKDSLRKGDVKKFFQEKLLQSAINLPFELLVLSPTKTKPLRSGITVESASYSKSFLANFDTYQGYLFQKIIPQILFSFFLITITSCAFWLIFRSLQQQKRLTLLKNDLISNITHELKTPISTVSVAIEALSSFGGLQNPELTKEYLAISKNELNRLSILVDSVLKMAIFEQQQLDLHLSEINLKYLVEQVLNTMKLQFEKSQAQVKFEAHGQHFMFFGDEIHLTNVIYNLLDNALKYNTNLPEITIILTENPNQFTLTFTDNGSGIPKEFQQKIFEKFFRVPNGDTHNTKGYGLGLSYVKTIVEQHKGTINLVNKQGTGSEFKLSFPKNR